MVENTAASRVWASLEAGDFLQLRYIITAGLCCSGVIFSFLKGPGLDEEPDCPVQTETLFLQISETTTILLHATQVEVQDREPRQREAAAAFGPQQVDLQLWQVAPL